MDSKFLAEVVIGFVLCIFLVGQTLAIDSVSVMNLPATRLTAQAASDITFDFDTGTPDLGEWHHSTPFNQTSGGVTASFSSSPDPTNFRIFVAALDSYPPQFSGNYLTATLEADYSKPFIGFYVRNTLSIEFSQQLTSISLTFATADDSRYQEVPSNITLTAYLNSNATPPVGSVTTNGTFVDGGGPARTLSFTSNGQPFDLVKIVVPYQPTRGPNQLSGVTVFSVDNITVTTADVVPELSNIALFGLGALSLALALLIRSRRRTIS